MNDRILKEVLNEYQQLRMNEDRSLMNREIEILSKIPEIKNIRDQIISLAARQSREIIQNPSQSHQSTALQNKIAELKAREIELLLSNGYDRDYLMPRYRCTQCKDTGYVGDLVKEKCRCLVQRLIYRYYNLNDVKELQSQNFDTFDPNVFSDNIKVKDGTSQRQYMLTLREKLFEYQDHFPENDKHNILFTGKTGLGKTFLLNCMAKSALDKGYTVLKVSSYNLFEQLFKSRFSNSQQLDLLKNQVFKVDLLIIDDLGTETRKNNFTAEELFNILNERLTKGMHTYLSTNLALTELKERYSDRVTSRLFDLENTRIFRFIGQDIRLRQRA